MKKNIEMIRPGLSESAGISALSVDKAKELTEEEMELLKDLEGQLKEEDAIRQKRKELIAMNVRMIEAKTAEIKGNVNHLCQVLINNEWTDGVIDKVSIDRVNGTALYTISLYNGRTVIRSAFTAHVRVLDMTLGDEPERTNIFYSATMKEIDSAKEEAAEHIGEIAIVDGEKVTCVNVQFDKRNCFLMYKFRRKNKTRFCRAVYNESVKFTGVYDEDVVEFKQKRNAKVIRRLSSSIEELINEAREKAESAKARIIRAERAYRTALEELAELESRRERTIDDLLK